MRDPQLYSQSPTPRIGTKPARIASNAAWLSLDAGLDVIAALVSSILVARLLGPERLGHYAYALALVNLTGVVASLGAPVATRKYMSEYLARGDCGLALAVLRATARFQALVAFALVAGLLAWVGATGREAYLVPAILSLVPSLLRGIATGALLATEDARWTVRASMIATLVHLLGVLSVLALGLGVVGLTSALLVSRVVDLVVRWGYVERQVVRPTGARAELLEPSLRQRLIRFCWQATALLVLEVFVWNRCEILFLEHFSSIQNVAFFSIGFGAAQSVLLVSRVAASAAGLTLMAESGREPTRVAGLAVEVAYFMALLSVPLAALTVGLAVPLVELAYGARFAPAAVVLSILAAFIPFRAVFFAGQHLLIAKDDQRQLVHASVLGAVVDVALALVLIPAHGAAGAGVTKGLTIAATSAATWWAINRRYRVGLPLARVVRLLAVGGAAAIAMRLTTPLLPAWAGLLAGAFVGVVMLGIGVRLVGAIDSNTRRRLIQLGALIPARLAGVYNLVIRGLASGPSWTEQGQGKTDPR